MDFNGAIEALGNAVELDASGFSDPVEQAPAAPTPQGDATPTDTAASAPLEDSFTNVDPSMLPLELQPIYKSLQADYTRKTQGVAERGKQYESFGDPERVSQALAFVDQLQNPQYLQQFHGELSEYLQSMGLGPSEANQAASQHIVETQATLQGTLADYEGIPELAPVAQHVQSLEQKLSQLEASFSERSRAEQQERLHLAMVGEIQRQESAIRGTNPHYSQDDIDAIYEIGAYYDGNLITAQNRYEEIIGKRMTSYLTTKSVAAQAPSVPGGQIIAASVTDSPQTLDNAHRQAMERLREIEALG